MGWMISTAGALVVMVALWDIFETLWHPGGLGGIARRVFRLTWAVTKYVLPTQTRQLAGPLGVLGTVMVWAGLVVMGWTLIYLPHMPEGFHFGSELGAEQSSAGLAALYLSLVTVATLGFGDITPAEPALRLLAPLEALLGFVLLTAAIAWILQVYPALGRRRSVAKRLSILRSQQAADILSDGNPCVVTRMLESVTDGVIQAEADLLQYRESYYFWDKAPELSLAATLPHALTLAESGDRSSSREVRLAAAMLTSAVESIASRVDRVYLKTGAAAPDVLASYAADHGFEQHA